jgi:hypothetical protein
MTATMPRPLAAAEILAALDAAYRGEFANPTGWRSTRGRATAGGTAVQGPAGPVVLVLAAHGGAGASTAALLLGEAAATAGAAARLIDCAEPVRSGVAAATDAELGEDASGWRRGRRGRLEIDRPASPVGAVDDVAAPRRADAAGAGGAVMTVIDAGWPAWEVLAGGGWVSRLLGTAQLLVVCRACVPAVRQTEQLLAALPGTPRLAVLGPAKWPGAVWASCGPLLRAAREGGRVVPVPLDRQLAVTGLTAAALPKQLTSAGRALASQFIADLPALGRAG